MLFLGNVFAFHGWDAPFSLIIFVLLQQNKKNKRTRFQGDVVL